MRRRVEAAGGPLTVVGVLLLAAGLTACQGRTVWDTAPPSGAPGAPGVFRPGTVALSAADLAPVDAYLSVRNKQWILGDDVTVEASREYFGQQLTVNRSTSLVERRDTSTPDAMIVRLRYVGAPGAASVETNPRVLIGTGLTVSARRTLTVRLERTTDADRPVRLRVTATGDAARGRDDRVLQRGPQLVLGGQILRQGAAWRWVPTP